MADNKNNLNNLMQYNNYISLPTILTLIFLVLKLTNYITWSWWWVFSPLWITYGVVIILLIVVGFIIIKFKDVFEYDKINDFFKNKL